MIRTLALQLATKRITIPRLSPTHTQSRVIEFLKHVGDPVEPYDAVFVVECSPDLITPGFRDSPNQIITMIIENQEDGIITKLDTTNDVLNQWLDVDTMIGLIDDGDDDDDDDEPVDDDGDWTWQAYTHTTTCDDTKKT